MLQGYHFLQKELQELVLSSKRSKSDQQLINQLDCSVLSSPQAMSS